jgi:hypothetical protein
MSRRKNEPLSGNHHNMLLNDLLDKKLPYPYTKVYRDEVASLCNAFIDSGQADSKFLNQLMVDESFWSCISEALIYQRICHRLNTNRVNKSSGPDFLLMEGGRNIWIEVTCPASNGLPNEWLENNTNKFFSVPHDQILLKWTNAIAAKHDQLQSFINKKMVLEDDVYVIAINGCQLRNGFFPGLNGISQYPYAVEAVFAIGCEVIQLDQTTLKTVGMSHEERYSIPKSNGATVPAYAFLDNKYERISAIWAVDFSYGKVDINSEPSALIHNPHAINPLPHGYLKADAEYVARLVENSTFSISNILK